MYGITALKPIPLRIDTTGTNKRNHSQSQPAKFDMHLVRSLRTDECYIRLLSTPSPVLLPPLLPPNSLSFIPVTMKGKTDYGSFGGVLTLEPSKLDFSHKTNPSKIDPSVEIGNGNDDDGGGGDIGAGGGGGSNADDDDSYIFNDDDNESDSEGLFRRRRILVPEVFDAEALDAVLSEWTRTMKELPLSLVLACKMGLLSSAQLTKFMWINARSNIVRFLIRALPWRLSTDVVGKVTVDSSLPYKLLFEFACTVGWSLFLDWNHFHNADLGQKVGLLANGFLLAGCNAFFLWSSAPSNRYVHGTKSRKLLVPNNVFERYCYGVREFDVKQRIASFFLKALSFSALGFTAKLAQLGILSIFPLSKLIPISEVNILRQISSVAVQALGSGFAFGFLSNFHYQLLCGIEKGLDLYFDHKVVSLVLGLALRCASLRMRAYCMEDWWIEYRNVQCSAPLVSSQIEDELRNGFATGFGLLGSQTGSSTVKRRRMVKKKMGF